MGFSVRRYPLHSLAHSKQACQPFQGRRLQRQKSAMDRGIHATVRAINLASTTRQTQKASHTHTHHPSPFPTTHIHIVAVSKVLPYIV